MSEGVSRKKSYRWVSVSQGAYDGADWDSTDDELADNVNSTDTSPQAKIGSPERISTLKKLPPLPKLGYTQDSTGEPVREGSTEKEEEVGKEVETVMDTKAEIEEESCVSTDSITASRPVSKKLSVRSTSRSVNSVNDDLDSLMDQISKEMTPKTEQAEQFPSPTGSFLSPRISLDENLRYLKRDQSDPESSGKLKNRTDSNVTSPSPGEQPIGNGSIEIKKINSYIDDSIGESDDEPGNSSRNYHDEYSDESEDDFKVSKNGYFSNYISEDNASVDKSKQFPEDDAKDLLESPTAQESIPDEHTIEHVNETTKTEGKTSMENEERNTNQLQEEQEKQKEPKELRDNEKSSVDELPNKQERQHGNQSQDEQNLAALSNPPESFDDYDDDSSFFNHYGNTSSQSSIVHVRSSPQQNVSDSPVKLRQTSKTDLSFRGDETYSIAELDEEQESNHGSGGNDDDDDALSYTNSIINDNKPELQSTRESDTYDDERPFQFRNRVRESMLDSSDDDDDDDDDGTSGLNNEPSVLSGGYYTRMLSESGNGEIGASETDKDYSSENSGDDDEVIAESNSAKSLKDGTTETRLTKEDSASDPIYDSNSTVESNKEEHDLGVENTGNHETSISESVDSDGNSIIKSYGQSGDITNNNILPDNEDTENKDKTPSTRESINLGKWRPDTDSFRSGFVQETAPKPPPGFVIDENGEVVDLNPSSMRQNRVVSTYSEVESTWNAFPSQPDTGEDLETIADTKTIYDNSTIYNVPGIITNNNILPPLPVNIASKDLDVKSADSCSTSLINDSDSVLKYIEGDKVPFSSNLTENFAQEPSPEKPTSTKSKPIPQLDLDKLLSGKEKHASKIEKLNNHMKELQEFDSGIQTWINFSLKSSANSDTDFIFQEYKVNKHVRDAYEHADELNKKHTVSNTVANVNQNVNHLKKKVFSHTMKEKSKGLFSSIGKKL